MPIKPKSVTYQAFKQDADYFHIKTGKYVSLAFSLVVYSQMTVNRINFHSIQV